MTVRETVWHIISAEKITTTASSQQSGAAPKYTRGVRIATQTEDMRIVIGTNPTATSSSTLLPSGIVEYFSAAEDDKIAVIWDSAEGTCNITWMKD